MLCNNAVSIKLYRSDMPKLRAKTNPTETMKIVFSSYAPKPGAAP